MKKILLISDSKGFPRTFPKYNYIDYFDTYPYLVKKYNQDNEVINIMFGNILTQDLLNQAIGYYRDFYPDYIFIISGVNDCRPEALREKEKKFFNFFFKKISKKIILNPLLIKFRKINRTTPNHFKKTLNLFKKIFSKSNIFFFEICAGKNYESTRPGFNLKKKQFNYVAENIFASNFIKIEDLLHLKEGFLSDELHFNKIGHKLIFQKIIKIIYGQN